MPVAAKDRVAIKKRMKLRESVFSPAARQEEEFLEDEAHEPEPAVAPEVPSPRRRTSYTPLSDAIVFSDNAPHISGVYGIIRGTGASNGGVFSYRCALNGNFLYKVDDFWVIGPQNRADSGYLTKCSVKGFGRPWTVRGKWSDMVSSVTECTIVDEPYPLRFAVESEFANLEGGYIQSGSLVNGYPCYIRMASPSPRSGEDQAVAFWYDRARATWKVNAAPHTKGVYTYAKDVTTVDPTLIPPEAWDGGVITAIKPVAAGDQNLNRSHDSDPSKFTDEEFPPNTESLGALATPAGVEWVRGAELRRDKTHALFDEVSPYDLLQGDVGDCWLLASIAALAATDPQYIESLFLEKEAQADGKYHVTLYDIKINQWRTITVDDWLPCRPQQWWESAAMPLFAKAEGGELWAALLEKAFAKMVGSYGKLSGGRPLWAWQCLTGVEKVQSLVKNLDNTWQEFNVDVKQQKKEINAGDVAACPLVRKRADPKYDEVSVFKKLEQCYLQKYLMTATISGKQNDRRPDGLIEGHSYCVTQVREVQGQQLLHLANPWGNACEWNGAWSDNAPEWTNVAIREELNFVAGDDGNFWMHADDFLRIFTLICICPVASYVPAQRVEAGNPPYCARQSTRILKTASRPMVANAFTEKFPSQRWWKKVFSSDATVQRKILLPNTLACAV
eukprot:GEMP01029266.1.p1 GENE.GEMP01029266.1~~GEMP01029266.1.p1  ORF type:complete len:674 (+),score=174.94 GEMP01029266.1:198-2219(+)